MDFELGQATINGLLVLLYLGGVALRVVWPYLLKYLQTGEKFSYKFVLGQFLAAVIGLFGVMSQSVFLGELGAIGHFGAFVLGYGAPSIGRDGQKTADAFRDSRG